MKTILIADASPSHLEKLVKLAESEGYRLRAASDGIKARAVLERLQDEVRVFIVDWRLPGLSGIQLIEWIRSQPSLAHVEVIIQSDEIDLKDVRRGIDRGAYRFLKKPIHLPQFQAVLRAAASDSQLKQSLQGRLLEYEGALDLMTEGFFEVRTREEARALGIGISRFCECPEEGLGLHELLLNAVEHGNLGIGYREKSRLLDQGGFEEEVRRRLELPEYRDKRVRVKATRVHDGMEILIADEGPGFDYRRFADFEPSRVFDSHGRGVLLATALLAVKYIDPGNKVRVKIRSAPADGKPGTRARGQKS